MIQLGECVAVQKGVITREVVWEINVERAIVCEAPVDNVFVVFKQACVVAVKVGVDQRQRGSFIPQPGDSLDEPRGGLFERLSIGAELGREVAARLRRSPVVTEGIDVLIAGEHMLPWIAPAGVDDPLGGKAGIGARQPGKFLGMAHAGRMNGCKRSCHLWHPLRRWLRLADILHADGRRRICGQVETMAARHCSTARAEPRQHAALSQRRILYNECRLRRDASTDVIHIIIAEAGSGKALGAVTLPHLDDLRRRCRSRHDCRLYQVTDIIHLTILRMPIARHWRRIL